VATGETPHKVLVTPFDLTFLRERIPSHAALALAAKALARHLSWPGCLVVSRTFWYRKGQDFATYARVPTPYAKKHRGNADDAT